MHNHPAGDPSPSLNDTKVTKKVHEASETMQVRFIDHVIIGRPAEGRSGYFSYREAGLL
jgi:DNA repair protein RadC